MFQICKLDAFYDSIQVLFGISLRINEGEIVSLVGRNGVGKTTIFRAITLTDGVRRRGRIFFCDEDVSNYESFNLALKGIGYVPQGRRVFKTLTVEEHFTISFRKQNKEMRWTKGRMYEMFPELSERRRVPAARLSGGEQSMLAIARALLTNPKLLLLDEPSEGLAPAAIKRLDAIIRQLRDEGVSILLAEQNIDLAKVANRVYFISRGQVLGECTGDRFMDHEYAKEIFFK
ncbi:MAG: ATP-binding cassette domain-containing protein [Nitrososphaerota archaeon]